METFPDMPHLSTSLYLYEGELKTVQSFINNNTGMITYGELYGLKTHSGSPVIHFTSLEKMSPMEATFPHEIHPPTGIKDYHLDFVGRWFSFENNNCSIKEFLKVKLTQLERQIKFLILVEARTTTDYQTFVSRLRTFCLLNSNEGRKVACKVESKIMKRESPFRSDQSLRADFKCSLSKAGDAAYFESAVVKSSEMYNSVGEMSTLKDVPKTSRNCVELATYKWEEIPDARHQEMNDVNDIYVSNTCNMIQEGEVLMPAKSKEKVNHDGKLFEKVSEFGVHHNGQRDSTELQKETDVKETAENIENEKVNETNSEPDVVNENGQPDLTEPTKETDVEKNGEKIENEKVIETNSEPGVNENGQPDLTEPKKETDVDETENDLIKPTDTKSVKDEIAPAISSSAESEVTSESPAESSSGKEDGEDILSKKNNNPRRSLQSEVQEKNASDNDSTDGEHGKDEYNIAEMDENSRNMMKNMISEKIKEKLPYEAKCVGSFSFVIEIEIDAVWKIECAKKGQDEFGQTTVTVESKSPGGFKRSKVCRDSVDEITEFVAEGILEMNKKMNQSQ